MPNQIVVTPPFRKRGQNPFFLSSLSVGSATGSGGVEIGGSATASFTHGPQVESDIVIEVDFDNDGDFSESVEDITQYVLSLETTTGRDWPSLLTGKAGPGRLRMTLDNSDDRFNYFNGDSPLTTPPFSLKTGRKIRVRTSGSSNPDPTLLAKDRFRRSNGALGTSETSLVWSDPLANDFSIVSMQAKPATQGQTHIAVLDVSSVDYYAQATLNEVGRRANVVGLVYRYQDTDDYSLAVIDTAAEQIKLINVVAGTPTTIESEACEPYDHMTIGVLVSSTSVTMYLEGVPVMVDTAVQTDETEVGIYAAWGADDNQPEIDNFYVWDGLPVETEGILWTGDITDLNTTVVPGPEKFATIDASGWLAKLADQKVDPPSTVDGKKTGLLVGNVLAGAGLLHPPGPIDEGDITTGPCGFEEQDAIDAARTFEEAEFGFLYETQEGMIGFDSRSARSALTSQATFSDVPLSQYGYHRIEPYNWGREVFNRVFAGVAPAAPSGVTRTTYTQGSITGISPYDPADGAYVPFEVPMPATVNAGDLLLVICSVMGAGLGASYQDQWITPSGWILVSRKSTTTDSEAMDGAQAFAKVADGTEDSTTPTFFTTGAPGLGASHRAGAAHIYRITDWYGSIESGLSLSDYVSSSDPGTVFPSWGQQASLFIAARHGTLPGLSGPTVSGTVYPLGYTDGATTTASNTSHANIQTAYKYGVEAVENPGSFGGTYSGFTNIQSVTIAVRGSGDPDANNGIEIVQVDDTDSQDDHNAIKTYRNPSNLFVDSTAATTYANLVLTTYADDRPIFAISFYPVRSGAYRSQAIRRRVSQKITLVATSNSGLGVSADFFIESINHRWSNGNKLWETTWELSPA